MFASKDPLIEAGHYYESKGPTVESSTGWQIALNLSNGFITQPEIMLLIDDLHTLQEMHPEEAALIELPDWSPSPEPSKIFLESDTIPFAEKILASVLLSSNEYEGALPKKKRAKANGSGKVYLSTFPITDEEGFPLCVLMDAGLSLWKAEQGHDVCINILPKHYEEQQQQLHELTARAFTVISHENPKVNNFQLITVLFDDDNTFWVMQPEGDYASQKWEKYLFQNNFLTTTYEN